MERARREGGEMRRETKGRMERRREAGTEAGLLGKRREVATPRNNLLGT
jgi:ribosome modulation factor